MTKIQVEQEYTTAKRISAGLKRLWKYVVVASPIIIDAITPLDVPYKERVLVILVALGAMEKALQKDRNK